MGGDMINMTKEWYKLYSTLSRILIMSEFIIKGQFIQAAELSGGSLYRTVSLQATKEGEGFHI